jgi:ribosome-associated protein
VAEFKLKNEFIELDNLLKICGLVSGTAEAKDAIRGGRVRVNGEVEVRVRRKVKAGARVIVGTREIAVV